MNQAEAHDRLIRLLVDIGFDLKYYDCCIETKRNLSTQPFDLEQAITVIERLPYSITRNTEEQFLRYRVTEQPELGMNIRLDAQSVELILVFNPGYGHIGNGFSGLALEAVRLRKGDSRFKPSPPYPTPKFGDASDLHNVLTFSFALFKEIESSINGTQW